MDGERTPTRLGDFVALIRGTTYKSSLLGQPGPFLLGLASIFPEGGFRGDNLKTYGGDTPPNLRLSAGDLFVSLKDVTQAGRLLGAIARVPSWINQGRLTQDTVKLILGPTAPSPNFVYWLLRTPEFRAYCKERATGTTNLGLARSDFLSFEVPEPTQARVHLCELLTLLDDKIALNRRMAAMLEAMIQAMFKSWFVDFDPVHAKIEGRDTGLPAATGTLFPDKFGENGLPEGWSKVPLLDHARLISGGTPKTEEPTYWGGPILWASAKDVSQCADLFLTGTERTITRRGLEESATRMVPALSTVVVARGATTGRHCLFGREMAMNQTCYALHSEAQTPFWLASTFSALVDELVHGAHGSVFDTITTTTLQAAKIVHAGHEIVSAFERAVQPIFERVLNIVEEAETLRTLRDTLLPRLVSGELRLKNVGNDAEAA